MRWMTVAVFAVVALLPGPAAASQWGSDYGDPWGFCPDQSYLPSTYATVVTNDPSVGNNPEQSTFWGIHEYPGYDDWFGYWYGDFAGRAGDDSGWHYITTSYYGAGPGHWNFGDFGWQVHGHAKQYIAYYNWSFGGDCGYGWYGSNDAPPYMADVYGYPVVDIYVDSVPPNDPAPRVTGVTSTSVTFAWDPVTDRGDGAGADYYVSGLDHYHSWIEVGGVREQEADSGSPRVLSASGLRPGTSACVHVSAVDVLGNWTGDQVACGQALEPPTAPAVPPAPSPPALSVNPYPVGVTGLDSWFWVAPAPSPAVTASSSGGYSYTVTQTPRQVVWTFGDGAAVTLAAPGGFGVAYPAQSTVIHRYESYSAGYAVSATTVYTVSWTATDAGGTRYGPYAMPDQTAVSGPISYPVQQVQPELVGWG